MPVYRNVHDTLQWHVSDITSRIVAESGNPDDRFHLGKIILQSLKDTPDQVAQIEGVTGNSETNSSLLRRSIQCAVALKKLGCQYGDVMILMAPHHLDLAVPFYAAFYLGLINAPIDRFLGVWADQLCLHHKRVDELRKNLKPLLTSVLESRISSCAKNVLAELVDTFTVTKPKIVFCQNEKVEDIQKALKKAEIAAKIVTFDKGSGDIEFSELLELGNDSEVDTFCPAAFDPSETISILIPTSGTTGKPKSVVTTHKNYAILSPYLWSKTLEVPPFKSSLVISPLQWGSAIIIYICAPIMKVTRIQSQQAMTQEHIYELINQYRPRFALISSIMMTTLMIPAIRDKCDFTCFEQIMLGGSVIYCKLIKELRIITPETYLINAYGMSELTNLAFIQTYSSPPESCGKPMACWQYRLVDPETERDIDEPNVKGELMIKGPGLFKGYYNDPEETNKAFDGEWFKTGDIFYRDESWSFYFVERIKLLLKYKSHKISPVELEEVIRQHPGVLDVAVTGIPDPECGDLPVACVVPTPGLQISAQEIKNLVKESLTDKKQLRGGVIFLEQLPVTATSKVNRRKIKEIALSMKRE